MKITFLIALMGLIMVQAANAELISPLVNENSDESVIEIEYLEDISWEEPAFGSRIPQRDIAEFKEAAEAVEFEWQGQLAVLKEIPYSYPELTRSQLQREVLGKVDREADQD